MRNERAKAIAQSLQQVQTAAKEVGAQLLYTLVPEQRTVYAANYPDWMLNPSTDTARNRAALLPALDAHRIMYLDMTDVFLAMDDPTPYYSRVDHHYTLKGAYLTYAAVCKTLGLSVEDLTIIDADTELLGTYNRKLYGLSPVHEQMQVLLDKLPAFERFDNGQASSLPLIAEQTGTYGLYSDYMGGDIGQTVIATSRPELPSILIVGDSFTNALESLAVFSFDEMRSLDYRHFDGASLQEYIRTCQPDYVLIVRDDVSCLDASGNGVFS